MQPQGSGAPCIHLPTIHKFLALFDNPRNHVPFLTSRPPHPFSETSSTPFWALIPSINSQCHLGTRLGFASSSLSLTLSSKQLTPSMAVKVRPYRLPPTTLIPNSPHPLLHYPGLLLALVGSADFKNTDVFDLFASNGWQTQWIARYGPDIQSHYHSTTHECMAVISGEGATIRFGVADSKQWHHGKFPIGHRADGEGGGLELQARLGDVFIIPAGVAHKTYAPKPTTSELAFHQPEDIKEGKARDINPEVEAKRRAFFATVPVSGEFMMMGAYPYGGLWDFSIGGEHQGHEKDVWDIPKPEKDPVLGLSKEGLPGLWTSNHVAT